MDKELRKLFTWEKLLVKNKKCPDARKKADAEDTPDKGVSMSDGCFQDSDISIPNEVKKGGKPHKEAGDEDTYGKGHWEIGCGDYRVCSALSEFSICPIRRRVLAKLRKLQREKQSTPESP